MAELAAALKEQGVKVFPFDHARQQAAQNGAGEDQDSIRWVDADKVKEEKIDWLCHPYIPRGYLVGVIGEEGIGKSYLTCSLAASMTTGRFFNGETAEPGIVLMMSAEDSYSAVTVPRLRRLGADLTKVKIIDQPLTLDDKGLTMLEHDIIRRRPALVILDPAFAYTRGDTNTSKDSRSVLDRLAHVAKAQGCAILLVRHIGKGKGGGDPRAAGLGSIEWRTVVRSELLVGKDPDDAANRSLTHTKCNLAPLGKAWGYEITGAVNDDGHPIRDDIGNFRWTGESDLTAERILSTLRMESDRSESDEAEHFLEEELQAGERYSDEIYAAAAKQGIAVRTLKRAISKLQIKSRKLGFGKDGCWLMRLPGDEPTITECQKQPAAKSKKDSPKSAKQPPKSAIQNEPGTLRANEDSKAFTAPTSPKSANSQLPGTLKGEVGTLSDSQRATAELHGQWEEGEI
jgi:RecA-family ATPase